MIEQHINIPQLLFPEFEEEYFPKSKGSAEKPCFVLKPPFSSNQGMMTLIYRSSVPSLQEEV